MHLRENVVIVDEVEEQQAMVMKVTSSKPSVVLLGINSSIVAINRSIF